MAQHNKRPRNPIIFTEPSMTQQQFKAECDINKIMAKYQKNGVLSHINTRGATYGDFDAVDFQQAMETIRLGNEMFDELPSRARLYFNNDPAEFMEFVNNPDNAGKLEELGLSFKPPVQTEPENTPQSPQDPPQGDNS